MYDYYCKNCNNIVGKWNNEYKCYDIIDYCDTISSKNIKLINFLDCINCNKFVGIFCYHVCEICYGEDLIFGEKNLFNWFLKYKKSINKIKYSYDDCKICDNDDFRYQQWYFKELTFTNKKHKKFNTLKKVLFNFLCVNFYK